jgi:hypothetical protein
MVQMLGASSSKDQKEMIDRFEGLEKCFEKLQNKLQAIETRKRKEREDEEALLLEDSDDDSAAVNGIDSSSSKKPKTSTVDDEDPYKAYGELSRYDLSKWFHTRIFGEFSEPNDKSKAYCDKIANELINAVGPWDIQVHSLSEEITRRQKMLDMVIEITNDEFTSESDGEDDDQEDHDDHLHTSYTHYPKYNTLFTNKCCNSYDYVSGTDKNSKEKQLKKCQVKHRVQRRCAREYARNMLSLAKGHKLYSRIQRNRRINPYLEGSTSNQIVDNEMWEDISETGIIVSKKKCRMARKGIVTIRKRKFVNEVGESESVIQKKSKYQSYYPCFDSGASVHATGYKSLFAELHKLDEPLFLYDAGGTMHVVKEVGTVQMMARNIQGQECVVTFKGVQYATSLKGLYIDTTRLRARDGWTCVGSNKTIQWTNPMGNTFQLKIIDGNEFLVARTISPVNAMVLWLNLSLKG